MLATFVALALVMAAMIFLTRFARQAPSPVEKIIPPSPQAPQSTPDEREAPLQVEGVSPDQVTPVDLELPAGIEIDEIVAAVVAVATARELAQQRRSARVWLSAKPRSLISPWQLVARGWQMNRSRR
jgi:hypothetical protein